MGIYLDEAATSKVSDRVIKAMMPYLKDQFYNPSSLYSGAVKVAKDIRKAREAIASFVNAKPEEIYFTSGASEANTWAIKGAVSGILRHNFSKIYPINIGVSAIEHKSIREFRDLTVLKHEILVDEDGFLGEIEHNFDFVSVQFANNEIGTIQDIKGIAEKVHSWSGIFHTDATQAFGQVLIDVKELNVDLMSVGGHKIGAPKGIGFLYVKNGTEIEPLIYGSQEGGLRGGTENVPYIIGFAEAVKEREERIKLGYIDHLRDTQDFFVQKLRDKFNSRLIGSPYKGSRLPNNISIMLPAGINAESVLYLLDTKDIQVSTGSACDSKRVKQSNVLKTIGLTEEESNRVLRITMSLGITKDEAVVFVDSLASVISSFIKN